MTEAPHPDRRRFLVMAERCNQCLYSKNKIVSDERRRELLATMRETDDYFVCHKATLAHRHVVCRGDYDANGGGHVGELARRLGLVTPIREEDLQQGTQTDDRADVERADGCLHGELADDPLPSE